MTDDKNPNEKQDDKIDLDAEIGNLEELLHEHDETLDQSFPVDDNNDYEELVAPTKEKEKSSGWLKYIAYFAFVGVLAGGGFALYKYLPAMMQNTMLSDFEKNMANRSNNLESFQQPQSIIPEVVEKTELQADPVPVIEEMAVNEPLPTRLDQVDNSETSLDDIVIYEPEIDEGNTALSGFAEPAVDSESAANPDEANSAEDDMQPAETIAEALAITQEAVSEIEESAEEIDVLIDNNDIANINLDEGAVNEEEQAAQTALASSDTVLFERIPAAPLQKGNIEENMISEEVISDENEIEDNNVQSEISEAIAENIVSVVDEVSETESVDLSLEPIAEVNENKDSDIEGVVDNTQEIVEEIGLEDPQNNSTPEVVELDAAVEESIIDSEIQTIDDVDLNEQEVSAVSSEEQPVETVTTIAQEVISDDQKMPSPPAEDNMVDMEKISEPQVVDVQTKIAKPVPKIIDPRIEQARMLMQKMQFQEALENYKNVLIDDPSNTAALTGQQLAMAKLRMSQVKDNEPRIDVDDIDMSSDLKEMDKKDLEPQNPELEKALSAMALAPKDARAAVNVAKIYQDMGDNQKAIDWYRKALQLDVIYKSGINRMAIYDALAELQ